MQSMKEEFKPQNPTSVTASKVSDELLELVALNHRTKRAEEVSQTRHAALIHQANS